MAPSSGDRDARPAPRARGWADRAAELGSVLLPALVAAVARLGPLGNADLLWQARTGDVVLSTGHRLATDEFTRTLRGAPIHDHEPAWEAFVALIDRTPWRFLVLWWANLLLAIVVVVLATRAARSMVEAPWARAIGASVLVFAASIRLELRADVASFVAIGAAFAIRRAGDSWPRRLAPVLCGAIGIHFHGLAWLAGVVPVAFALEAAPRAIGGVLEGEGAREARDARDAARRSVAIDLAIAGATVFVCELLARGTLRNVLANASGRAFLDHVLEVQSPLAFYRKSGNARPLFALGAVALAVAGLAWLVRHRRARLADLALVVLLAIPALRWVRFVVLPLLATLPWAIGGCAALFDAVLGRARALVRWSLADSVAAALVGVLALDVAEVGVGAQLGGFDFRAQPVAAVDWLRAHRPNATLFHTFNHGAYLIYARWPGGVVIDARAPIVYPDAYTQRYYAALDDPSRFEAWAQQEGFDTVLLARRHRGSRHLRRHLWYSRAWRLAYEDAGSLVFVHEARPASEPQRPLPEAE